MSRSIDDIICDFEFCCTRQKNGLMSRFFFEPWEYKMHQQVRLLFDFLNYLNKKITKLKVFSDRFKSDLERIAITKKCVESKITDLQYHNVSAHVARTLYECYDEQNGFWS